MFRFCVWYLVENHDLCRYKHQPHITLKHSMSLVDAYEYYNTHKHNATPSFTFYGQPIATYDKNRKFASIEQPLLVSGCPVEHIHISLQYGTKPFETSDVRAAISTFADVYDRVEPMHIRLCVVDCTSRNPLEWIVLNN